MVRKTKQFKNDQLESWIKIKNKILHGVLKSKLLIYIKEKELSSSSSQKLAVTLNPQFIIF